MDWFTWFFFFEQPLISCKNPWFPVDVPNKNQPDDFEVSHRRAIGSSSETTGALWVLCYVAKMAVEMVDFRIFYMVFFHGYVTVLPEGKWFIDASKSDIVLMKYIEILYDIGL